VEPENLKESKKPLGFKLFEDMENLESKREKDLL
jgi:hypothetical protein